MSAELSDNVILNQPHPYRQSSFRLECVLEVTVRPLAQFTLKWRHPCLLVDVDQGLSSTT